MRLLPWLKKNGIRQKAFAQMVGVSYPTIHRIAHGKVFPQVNLVSAIHDATGGEVTANDLFHHHLEQAGTPLETQTDKSAPA